MKKLGLRRRLQRTWINSRWYLIGLAWLITLTLGTLGFRQYYAALPEQDSELSPGLLTLAYYSFQLFTLESGGVKGAVPLGLEIARWLAPFLAAYTAIAALTMVFAEQFQLLWLRRVRNHVIVCGLGRRGFLLAEGFIQRGDRVVVIEKDKENDLLEACRDLGVITLVGDATHPEMLSRAGIVRARCLVAVNGEDAINAEIAIRARSAREKTRHPDGLPLTCLVHISDPKLCDLLHEQEIPGSGNGGFRLEFFNVYDMGAKAILDQFSPFPERINPADPPVHILLVGLGSMGRSLVVRAARQWRERLRTVQLAGQLPAEMGRLPLKITVIDRDALRKVEVLQLRFPKLSQVSQIRALQMDINWPEFQKGDFLFGPDGQPEPDIVYICLDNDALSLMSGLTLHQHLRGLPKKRPASKEARTEGDSPRAEVPIVFRTTNETAIGGLFAGMTSGETTLINKPRGGLIAFGLLERTCQPDLVLGGSHEILARSLHEKYLLSPANSGQNAQNNPSLKAWDELDETGKEKNRRQADRIGRALLENGYGIQPLIDWDSETCPFSEEEIKGMAQSEHRLYVEEMLSLGWMPGPRNPKKKTNPNLVPWEQLSGAVQEQNREPFRSIQWMLAEIGLQAYLVNSEKA